MEESPKILVFAKNKQILILSRYMECSKDTSEGHKCVPLKCRGVDITVVCYLDEVKLVTCARKKVNSVQPM